MNVAIIGFCCFCFFVIASMISSIQSNTAGIVETAFVLVAARNVWKELCLALQVQYINILILFANTDENIDVLLLHIHMSDLIFCTW